MSNDPRIDRLIDVLIGRTEQKSLEWQSTPDEDTFRLISTSGNIRVTKGEKFDEDARETYIYRILSVLNDKGRVIEEHMPEGLAQQKRFDKLFDLARRAAYKTEEILDQIIKEIETDVLKKDQPEQ